MDGRETWQELESGYYPFTSREHCTAPYFPVSEGVQVDSHFGGALRHGIRDDTFGRLSADFHFWFCVEATLLAACERER